MDLIMYGTTITGSWFGAGTANMENRAMKVMCFAPRTLARLNHLCISRIGSAQTGKGGEVGVNVMMSIKPEWCKRIIYGEKTIEVRKTKPEQIETPFTVYVYATFGGENWFSFGKQKSGRVIGKFTCDKVVRYDIPYPAYWKETSPELLEKSCVPYMKLHHYADQQGYVYGWHIQNFENWETPLTVSEFLTNNGSPFKRPPQSWAYAITRW